MKQQKEHKEAFVFTETKPCLDWFTTEEHTINDEDFTYFKLDRRYGPDWWLIGMKTVDKPTYHWEEKEIGRICEADLSRFIDWAKYEDVNGNRIIDIHMISGNFDIFAEVGKLLNSQLVRENKELKELLKKAIEGLRGNCKECAKYDTCGNRKGSHYYCWEWKHANTKFLRWCR